LSKIKTFQLPCGWESFQGQNAELWLAVLLHVKHRDEQLFRELVAFSGHYTLSLARLLTHPVGLILTLGTHNIKLMQFALG